jgi:hypothetical protein
MLSLVRCGKFASLIAILTLFPFRSYSQNQGLVAKWSFNEEPGAVTRDSVSGKEDKIEGFYKYVPGVSGSGLRFDGYTTSVIRNAANAPKPSRAFTVEAWVALNTYPWDWVPVVDEEEDQRVGFFFGIDAYGHVGLQLAIEGEWQSLTSTVQIPLKKWAHIVGTFDPAHGLAVYLNGKRVGELKTQGKFTPTEDVDLLIGRVREEVLPTQWIHPKYAVRYSLDGILDEISIYDRNLNAEEIEKSYSAANAPGGEVLPWPVLPSGPGGPGRFGAYYCTLKYQDTWDRPWRIGPDADVVVRFDQSPIRLVFWHGTGYIPAWVTENSKWYTDEFLETGGSPECPDGEDCEPMSDKQTRYSHVRVLESNDARVIVHWRYALSEVEHYKGANPDPLTGWFDWADEYWTVYPDGVAVRKQVLWSSNNMAKGHEWQESIIINQPGTRPEDNVNLDAVTLGNMKGESFTYSWAKKTPPSFDKPSSPNIQVVNLKSKFKPFTIVPPQNAKVSPYRGELTKWSNFPWWNHWPVAQIASSGRSAVAPDRASHSSVSHINWEAYSQTGDTMTKIILDGLTIQSIAELVPLAKSWLSPPKMEMAGQGFRNEGYDPTQRAFVLVREGSGKLSPAELTLQASQEAPVVNPAIVIKNWGEEDSRLTINGKPVVRGKDFRLGHVATLEGTHLVVWIHKESEATVRISLTPSDQ